MIANLLKVLVNYKQLIPLHFEKRVALLLTHPIDQRTVIGAPKHGVSH